MFIRVTKRYKMFDTYTSRLTLNSENIQSVEDGDEDVRVVTMREGVTHRVQESHEYFEQIRRNDHEKLVKSILDAVLQVLATNNKAGEHQTTLPLEFRDPEVPIHNIKRVRTDQRPDRDGADVDSSDASSQLDIVGI